MRLEKSHVRQCIQLLTRKRLTHEMTVALFNKYNAWN